MKFHFIKFYNYASILLNAIQKGDMKTFQFVLSKVGIDINKKIINFI